LHFILQSIQTTKSPIYNFDISSGQAAIPWLMLAGKKPETAHHI
jgi:hypothetical protein